MDEPTTCPRGHPVASAATRCTVCGLHVVPSAPNPFDPPARTVTGHRRPRSWRRVRIAPIVGALIVVAVVAGWIVGGHFLAPRAAPVAGAVAATTETAVSVAVPQAGTVVSPSPSPATVDPSGTSTARAIPDPESSATPAAGSTSTAPAVGVDGCTVAGATSPSTCSPSGERVTFPVCVPSDATAVEVRTRKAASEPWKAPADKADLQGQGACPSGEVEAQLTIKVKSGVTKLVRVQVRSGGDEPVATVRASVTRSTTP